MGSAAVETMAGGAASQGSEAAARDAVSASKAPAAREEGRTDMGEGAGAEATRKRARVGRQRSIGYGIEPGDGEFRIMKKKRIPTAVGPKFASSGDMKPAAVR